MRMTRELVPIAKQSAIGKHSRNNAPRAKIERTKAISKVRLLLFAKMSADYTMQDVEEELEDDKITVVRRFLRSARHR